jgi:hypothetical protein
MANSTRNRTQPQPPFEVDSPSSALEVPSIWHAAPASACWTGASATGAGRYGTPFPASGRPALRLRRPPRRRTLLHCSRPTQGAAARFTSCDCEFLAH